MVILEIDGQKYAGPTYISDFYGPDRKREQVEKLAVEIAETVLIHYGYSGTIRIQAELIETEDENDHEVK